MCWTYLSPRSTYPSDRQTHHDGSPDQPGHQPGTAEDHLGLAARECGISLSGPVTYRGATPASLTAHARIAEAAVGHAGVIPRHGPSRCGSCAGPTPAS